MAQDIQVLGKRNEKDKLTDINLTRSVVLNDLTQEQLRKIYRIGRVGALYKLEGFNFDCSFEANVDGKLMMVAANVNDITFDSEKQAVVFNCGYSATYDKFIKFFLYKKEDGTYDLLMNISAPVWVDKDDLKTINGQSLVGTGDIEIAAGNKVYDITDMNVDERIALYNALKDRTITLMNSTIAYYNNAAGEEAIMTSLKINDTDGAIFSFLYKGKILGLNLKSDGTYEIIRTWEE